MGDVHPLHWLTTDHIEIVVRQQSGDDATLIISWTHDRLVGGGGEGIGVWRVLANAHIHGMAQQWSMVLKGWNAPLPNADPTAFNWPHREMELYRSGLLAGLPGGIRAPAYFGDTQGEDGSVWVWLEDITDAANGLESIDDYAAVARRLGQFNGAWAVGHSLPTHPGLSQDWTRQWVEATGPYLPGLREDAGNPYVREAYPPHVIDAYMHLWNNRHAAYARLDELPRSFSHLDTFSRNIFIRRENTTPGDVILIDWSFSGIAAIGEELAPLVGASAWFMDTPTDTIGDVEDAVIDAYVRGLQDAGWRGDPELIRPAFRTAIVLRYGLGAIRIALAVLRGEWARADVEQLVRHSFDEYVTNLCELNSWMVSLIHELDVRRA